MNTSSSSNLSMTGIEYDDFNVLQEQIVYTNIPQTISSVKTFSVLPVSSVLPTASNEFSNKAYVDTNIETVSNNLNTEITNRTNADTTLQTNITTVSNNLNTEITNRTNADTTLQTNITTVSNNLTTEITNRTNADTTLQTNITTVSNNLTTEITNRINADTALQNSISSVDSSVVHIGGNETITGSKIFENNNFLVRDASSNDRIVVSATETDIRGNDIGISTTDNSAGISIYQNNIISLSPEITNIGSLFNDYFETSKDFRYGTVLSNTSKLLINGTNTNITNDHVNLNGKTNIKGDFLVEDTGGTDKIKVDGTKTTITNFSTSIKEPIFVMVGLGATDGSVADEIATSTDGINWTGRNNNLFTISGRCVAWNGSLWVAGGHGATGTTDTIATSLDGITWTGRSSIFIITFSIAWNGSLWVAVGSGFNDTIATSIDGITWIGRGKTVFSSSGNGVAWNGSLWVAVGNGTTDTIATSPDGINWTGQGLIFSTQGNGVDWNGSIWVAVGNGTTDTIATSPDGINWTGQGNTAFSVLGNAIAWNGSLWVAVGDGAVNTIAYSYNGINWFGRGKTILNVGSGIAWIAPLSLWYAVGGATNSIATSPDGINWTARGKGAFPIAAFGVASGDTPKLEINNNTTTIVNETIRINGELILTGFANVEAITTFSEPVTAPTPTLPTHLSTRAYVDVRAFDNQVVHLSGAETISGNKTFSGTNTITGNIVANSLTISPTELSYIDGATSNIQTQLNDKASISYVDTEISQSIADLVSSAPSTLDTLNELAAALGDDPNFATTVSTQIGLKANDAEVVHKSLTETITGAKTFTQDVKIDGTGNPTQPSLIFRNEENIARQENSQTYYDNRENHIIRYADRDYMNFGNFSILPTHKITLGYNDDIQDVYPPLTADAPTNHSIKFDIMPYGTTTLQETLHLQPKKTTIKSNDVVKYEQTENTTTLDNGTININGATTFNTVVSAPSTAPTLNTHLTNKAYVDTNINTVSTGLATEITNRTNADTTLQTQITARALDTDVVKLAGTQTITGAKTFQNDNFLLENSAGTDTINVNGLTTTLTNDTINLGTFPIVTYVKLLLDTGSNYLNIAELEAYTADGTNVALNKTVTGTFSTTYPGTLLVNGTYTDFAHSTSNTGVRFFMVDLGAEYKISRVKIWNRTGFFERAIGIKVQLIDADGVTILKENTITSSSATYTYDYFDNKMVTNATETTLTNDTININGATTFNTVVVAPNTAPTLDTHLTNKLYVDTNINTVSTGLATEITNRTNADTTLQTNIDTVSTGLATEITNRTNADTTLQTNINTVSSGLASEITNRTNADTTLQTNINTVSTGLASEITNRINADTTLQTQITARALDTDVVHKTGTETITGSKIFQNDNFLVENSAGTDTINVSGTTTTLSNADNNITGRASVTQGKLSLGTTLSPTLGGNWLTLRHNTYTGSVGPNFPNPECGILMSNNTGGGIFAWNFYTGAVKYFASSGPTLSMRQDWGIANNIGSQNLASTPTISPIMTMLYSGNVGINTTLPTSRLQVVGSVDLDGKITTSGTTTTLANNTINLTASSRNTLTSTATSGIGNQMLALDGAYNYLEGNVNQIYTYATNGYNRMYAIGTNGINQINAKLANYIYVDSVEKIKTDANTTTLTNDTININGATTFNTVVSAPSTAPTLDTHLVNKKYVDDLDALTVHKSLTETITGAKTFQNNNFVVKDAGGNNKILVSGAETNIIGNDVVIATTDATAEIMVTTNNVTTTSPQIYNAGEVLVNYFSNRQELNFGTSLSSVNKLEITGTTTTLTNDTININGSTTFNTKVNINIPGTFYSSGGANTLKLYNEYGFGVGSDFDVKYCSAKKHNFYSGSTTTTNGTLKLSVGDATTTLNNTTTVIQSGGVDVITSNATTTLIDTIFIILDATSLTVKGTTINEGILFTGTVASPMPLCNFTLSGVTTSFNTSNFQVSIGGLPDGASSNGPWTFMLPFKCRVVAWTLSGDSDAHSAMALRMRVSTATNGGGTIYYDQQGNLPANGITVKSVCMGLNGNINGWTSVFFNNTTQTIPAGTQLFCFMNTSAAMNTEMVITLFFQQYN